MPSPMISFRAVPPLNTVIDSRRRLPNLLADPFAAAPADEGKQAAAGAVAARDLSVYYRLLAAELADANLSPAKAHLVLQGLNGVFIDSSWLHDAPALLAQEISDAGLDDDGAGDPQCAAFVEDVQRWPRLRAIAVIEAAKAWYLHPMRATEPDTALREVGLLPRGTRRTPPVSA
jgi:hypothetical protein